MNDVPAADIRSFALVGHTGSGKTALTDAILVHLGVAESAGSVASGTSLSDYTDEEKERKISLYATQFNGPYKTGTGKTVHVFVTDTPGYDDFYGQVVAATHAVDAALVVIDAGSGIQVGTSRAWKRLARLGRAVGIVVTGLDKENTDFSATVEAIRKMWGGRCAPVVIPATDGASVVNAMDPKADSAQVELDLDEVKNSLVELAAETDDGLIEKYLGGEALSVEELSNGLRVAVRAGKLVPIFAVFPEKDIGVVELLDGVANLLPDPTEIEVKDAAGNPLEQGPDAPFVGQVWRVVTDPFVGQLSFVRVFSGTLAEGAELVNVTKGSKEKAGAVLAGNGKKQVSVSRAACGDIVALAKLKGTDIGDILCSAGHSVKLDPILFPSPVMSYALRAKEKAGADKIGSALAKIAKDDPTIRVDRNAETRELILSGMGDIQIEVALGLMKKRSNVDVDLSTPKVSYRETVTASGEGRYKHKKQSGGRGQYGEVYARVQPRPEGDEEWFADEIFGGAIPKNFIPAVQKGFVEAMSHGAVAGFPVVSTKAIVYDGSFHDVDSSEIAFKIAASRAFEEAMQNAKPVLLEPIMKVHVTITDQDMGDVNGDLNQRRGRILGMGLDEGMQVITAEVPQAELFRYASELRSMTGGRGSFEMEFSRYEVVPANVAQKVVSEKAQQKANEG